ncbi:hypothetical protein D0T84_22230 [Dysgonomonas sp. 521]|uniref:hypothetical protein n=1 Tax=Dysgonomonas sp. 521 TaxID=2302932 RepID=UPI0013D119CA|nr:hypothetical protein [Dysgonomonas sp. 521]NDV97579.1 hypothetical protein [Dysgonomonas sp. 521]
MKISDLTNEEVKAIVTEVLFNYKIESIIFENLIDNIRYEILQKIEEYPNHEEGQRVASLIRDVFDSCQLIIQINE